MITVVVDVIAKYNKPRIDNEWFKDRNKYSTFNSLEEFCNKRKYTIDGKEIRNRRDYILVKI